jgi:hypothetical protein
MKYNTSSDDMEGMESRFAPAMKQGDGAHQTPKKALSTTRYPRGICDTQLRPEGISQYPRQEVPWYYYDQTIKINHQSNLDFLVSLLWIFEDGERCLHDQPNDYVVPGKSFLRLRLMFG